MANRKSNVKIIPERLTWIMQNPPMNRETEGKYLDGTETELYKPKKVTRKQLATVVDRSESTIQIARTKGYISKDVLNRICEFFDTDENFLLGNDQLYDATEMIYNNHLTRIASKYGINKYEEEKKIGKDAYLQTVSKQEFQSFLNDYNKVLSTEKSENRLYNGNIIIGHFCPKSPSTDFIKNFIETFMNSDEYYSTSEDGEPNYNSTYAYKDLEPYIDDYINFYLVSYLNSSITEFMNQKLKGSTHNGRNQKKN